jgi:FMN-dependent NADH-azoreductase
MVPHSSSPAPAPAAPLPAAPRVLLVTASPREDSLSVPLAEAVVDRLRERRPETTVDRLDAFSDLRPFGPRQARAKMSVIEGRPVAAEDEDDWRHALDVAARVQAADLLVFAVPMWNGGVPWALKLFIDIVTQPGVAFGFDPAEGYHGLLHGRQAVTAYTSRVYAPGVTPPFGVDHQSTYLRWWLGFCGIDPVHELRLQTTFPDDDFPARHRDAVEQAHALADRLAA